MPRHVVVDGSNLATEGRTAPSLKQLEDAVMAYMAENPDDVITVVVDATFGHRIDPREVPEFDAAIENNEVVCPPAGAVGRGDAFVLSIANKAGATILSNDSFQEFHGQYGWLFDEGRLVGGKPVPNIGWVFVPRTPVRGPVSRRAMKDAKRGRQPEKKTVPMRASKEASQPMPVPKAPPPGPVRVRGAAAAAAAAAGTSAAGVTRNGATAAAAGGSDARPAGKVPGKHDPINELMPFLDFVERHPVGSTVEATVDAFSSHGAYVLAGEARCYVPLRHLGDPAPRSAREVLSLGEQRTFVVVSFNAQRRGIDVADPAFASAVAPADGVPVAVGALGEVARGAAAAGHAAAGHAAAGHAAAGDAAAGGGGAAGGGSGRGRRRRGRGRSGDRTAEGAAVTEAVVAGDGDVIVTSGAPAASGVGDEPATAPRRTSRKRAVKAEGVVSEVEEPVVTAAPPRRRAAASRAAAEPAAVQPAAVEPAAGAAATPKGPRRNTAAAPTKPATKKAVAPAAAPGASAAKAAAKKEVAEPPAQAAPAKATARKASAGKASAGQATAGQVPAKKVAAKKVAAKKVAAKKVAAKKAAAKKAAAKKADATTAAATSAATTRSSAKASTAATAAAVPPAPAKKAAARKAATKTSAPGS